MKRVASIQDISCLGRCSLTVALPVISAMEVECAILPTAVLSAHTMFPDILCRDLTADILPIARYWRSQQVQLDAVYTGYLASPRQVEDVCQALEVLAGLWPMGERSTRALTRIFPATWSAWRRRRTW